MISQTYKDLPDFAIGFLEVFARGDGPFAKKIIGIHCGGSGLLCQCHARELSKEPARDHSPENRGESTSLAQTSV